MTFADVTPDNHPALQGFKEVIPLSGFSGATVALVRDGGTPFVRKVSNRAEANAPLREQAYRQRELAALIEGCARMPSVINEGDCAGYYYFDMEFVPSRDAINFLSHSSFDNVAGFAERIERLMGRLAACGPVGNAPLILNRSLIAGKLDQIMSRINKAHESDLAPLVEAVSQLDEMNCASLATAVHGDLTFENILVDRHGELWLIDTIPSPADHYWIDWSKLFQECEGLWHAYRGRSLARGVTWWLRQRFFEAATRLDPNYPIHHYVFLGLTFARILPYARTEADRVFVGKRVIECGRAAIETIRQR